MKGKRYYHFKDFRVDVEERLVYDHQSIVPLTPKAFDTLLALVEKSQRVVSKQELMERVWPNTFVEENNLAQNISTLRKAFDTKGEKLIETVPKRGYRFVADVSESFDTPEATGRERSDSKKARLPLRDVVFIGRAIDFK
ncbi:MAG TPA: transcriptional regulator [Pyrinomonadaceae bacterium]|nr:transcriptional regulator [Pyrinomonadaceae bacterium]